MIGFQTGSGNTKKGDSIISVLTEEKNGDIYGNFYFKKNFTFFKQVYKDPVPYFSKDRKDSVTDLHVRIRDTGSKSDSFKLGNGLNFPPFLSTRAELRFIKREKQKSPKNYFEVKYDSSSKS